MSNSWGVVPAFLTAKATEPAVPSIASTDNLNSVSVTFTADPAAEDPSGLAAGADRATLGLAAVDPPHDPRRPAASTTAPRRQATMAVHPPGSVASGRGP